MSSNVLAPGSFIGRVDTQWKTGLVDLSVVVHDHALDVPVHAHERMFFCVLLRGSYREFVGDRTIEYQPLSIVYHPEGLEHHDYIGPGGARFLTLEVAPGLLGGELRRRRPLSSVSELASDTAVWRMLRLFREAKAGGMMPVSLEEQAGELVDVVAGTAAEHPRRSPSWLPRVDDFVGEHFRDPVSLADIAGIADVHPVYLSRAFRHFRGQPIRSVVHQRRVRYACELLQRTDRSLATIAVDAGFFDQSHMTRIFRRVTGMTPGRIRRLLTGVDRDQD